MNAISSTENLRNVPTHNQSLTATSATSNQLMMERVKLVGQKIDLLTAKKPSDGDYESAGAAICQELQSLQNEIGKAAQNANQSGYAQFASQVEGLAKSMERLGFVNSRQVAKMTPDQLMSRVGDANSPRYIDEIIDKDLTDFVPTRAFVQENGAGQASAASPLAQLISECISAEPTGDRNKPLKIVAGANNERLAALLGRRFAKFGSKMAAKMLSMSFNVPDARDAKNPNPLAPKRPQLSVQMIGILRLLGLLDKVPPEVLADNIQFGGVRSNYTFGAYDPYAYSVIATHDPELARLARDSDKAQSVKDSVPKPDIERFGLGPQMEIVGSRGVSGDTLALAKKMVAYLTSGNPALKTQHLDLHVEPYSPKVYSDGVVGYQSGALVVVPPQGDSLLANFSYKMGPVLVHEMGHWAKAAVFSKDDKDALKDAFEAVNSRLTGNSRVTGYARSNEEEFWAQATAAYFGVNTPDMMKLDGRDVGSRDVIKRAMPGLFALLAKTYGDVAYPPPDFMMEHPGSADFPSPR